MQASFTNPITIPPCELTRLIIAVRGKLREYFPRAAMDRLEFRSWPGNIRNQIQRCLDVMAAEVDKSIHCLPASFDWFCGDPYEPDCEYAGALDLIIHDRRRAVYLGWYIPPLLPRRNTFYLMAREGVPIDPETQYILYNFEGVANTS